MAIREFSPEATPRAKVAFIGYMPPHWHLHQFQVRNFTCEPITLEQAGDSKIVAQLDAVIWTQNPEKPTELPRQMKEVVSTLLDHDVRVYIRVADDRNKTGAFRRLVVSALRENNIPVDNLQPEEWRAVPRKYRERENSFLAPSVYIVDSALRWPAIATLVCDRPAGPSPKLELQFDTQALDDQFKCDRHAERVLLLQRAFWNCIDLRLSFLTGGLSGASVCKAYASLEAGRVASKTAGAYPHLYFVKIGPRKTIIDEYDKYCSYMFEYVPFHLGPRLRRERCNLGSTQGILVGDFVEGTESLIDCARGSRCGHAISNLFDRTLAGWRKQSSDDPLRTLGDYLADRWLVEESDALIALPEQQRQIVRRLGGEVEIAPLKRIFEAHSKTTPRYAPAHGDLHATNVLVRHGDAIIIDFEKLKDDYPLTYDPASLEGGLLVEGFIKDLNKNAINGEQLLELLKPLYTVTALSERKEILCPRGSLAEWYFDCVNQIRTLSWSAEYKSGQYALTLALCLIRKACNVHDGFTDEQRMLRAISFFFGQRILREIESRAKAGENSQ